MPPQVAPQQPAPQGQAQPEQKGMPPDDAQATQQTVLAGKKIMFDKKTFPMLKAEMAKNVPMAQKLVNGTVAVMQFVQDVAKGTIPRQVLIPASWLLLLEFAKFMEDSGAGQPTPEDIKAAKPQLVAAMKKAFPMQGQQGAAQQPAPQAQPMPPPQQGGIIGSAQMGA